MKWSRLGSAAPLLRCLAVVCLATTLPAESPAADRARPVLHLNTEFLPYKRLDEEDLHYRLGREVVRQAFLLAARDELGVMTVDETLHETLPDDANVVDLLLIERVNSSGMWRLKLVIPEDGQDIHAIKPLWTKTFKSAVGGMRVYGFLIPKLEEDSRGDFVEALRAAGLEGEKVANGKPTSPSEEVEKSLLKVDFIAQYGAVRAAHQAIVAHGESPEWLSVLVRGYANLAMLTQHQWNSSSEVFTARAWLYAQRMYSSKKERDFAIWNRAYAWALGGTLQHVEEDLERLERRREEVVDAGDAKASPYAPPVWAQLIKPYAMCDREAVRLVGEENPELGAWATRLDFQLASAFRLSKWMFDAAMEVREACPTAYGVYSELAHHGQALGTTRMGAQLAPVMFGAHSPASLLALPDLPDDFRAVLSIDKIEGGFLKNVFGDPDPDDEFSAVPTYVAKYLRERSKKQPEGDLSWSALAFLLEEEQFVEVANSLNVSLNATERPLAEDVDSVLPLVKDHRYARYIESYRYNARVERWPVQELVKHIVVEDPRRNMEGMFRRIWWIRSPERKILGRSAHYEASRNFTLPGMLEYVYWKEPTWAPEDMKMAAVYAKEFEGIAPHSETAIRMTLQATPIATVEQLQQWEEKLKVDPTAFLVLARHYWNTGHAEAAIRCYEKSLASLPTFDATYELATVHFLQGDRKKWEKTLLGFLETENLGLEHARARRRLAYGYASWGDWQTAKIHAVEAAGTWSAWGLEVASHVCEGLAQWEESERWMREKSTSYPTGSGNDWYLWCRRTGRGDLDAARELAKQHHSVSIKTLDHDGLFALGTFHLLEGKPREALEVFRGSFHAEPLFAVAFMIAQVSRDLDDEEDGKKALATMEEAVKKAQANSETWAEEVDMAVLELLKTGDTSAERLEKLEELLCAMDSNIRTLYAYFVGRELAAAGKEKEAEKYWRRAITTANANTNCSTLAGMELAKRHGTSRPDDDVLDEEDLWPKGEEL